MLNQFSIVLISLVGAILAQSNNVILSIARDSYGRSDPNALLNGFFPAWPVIILICAGI